MPFEDKGGDVFDVPVWTEFQGFLDQYIEAAGIADDPSDAPLS